MNTMGKSAAKILATALTGFLATGLGAFVLEAGAADEVTDSASWTIVNSNSTTYVVNLSVSNGTGTVTYAGSLPPTGDFPISVVNGNGESLQITLDTQTSTMTFVADITGTYSDTDRTQCENAICSNKVCTASSGSNSNCDSLGDYLGCYQYACSSSSGSGIGSVAGIDVTWEDDY
jgi:hypothetical protein